MPLSPEQLNQAVNDTLQLFRHLPIEAQEWLSQKTYEAMKASNNTSFYSLSSFKVIHALATAHGLDNRASVLEIGAGKPLGMGLFWNFAGAAKYTSIDKFVAVNLDDLWLSRFQSLLEMQLHVPAAVRWTDLIGRDGDGYRLNRERIDLIQGDFASHPFTPESFDFIYSFAVLEHVTDLPALLGKMRRLLRPRGLMIHLVDLREHHTHLRRVPDKDASVEFLRHSPAEWERLYPPGSEHYINRLRASDFRRAALAAGLEILELATTQETTAPEAAFADIHPDFRRYGIDDLKTFGIRLVLKKRSGNRTAAAPADRERS
jgi:SAM-dependent methyltransferase